MKALGLIEAVGYSTAVSAADAAVKAADVEIIGLEKVIGVNGYVSVTVHLSGDVAAVTSAVDAGREQGNLVGELISTEVIPRAHSDVNEKLLSNFKVTERKAPAKKTPVQKQKKKEKPAKVQPALDEKDREKPDKKPAAQKKQKQKNTNEKDA